MELYLVQHGPAKSETEDPQRPLTEEGRRTVERVAAFLAPLGPRIERIEHSGKLRARPTAGVCEAAGLAPNDDAGIVAAQLAQETANLMVVGHLPHLSRLVSRLLGLAADRPAVQFQMGGLVRLDRSDAEQWVIRWMLTPDLLAAVRRPDEPLQ